MLRHEAESIICATGWLALTPPEFQKTLLAQSDYGQVASDTQLFEAGKDGDTLLGIASGRVSIWMQPRNDIPRLVQVSGPGNWYGELAIFLGGPRRIMIKTSGEVWRFRVFRSAIQSITIDDPSSYQWFNLISMINLDDTLAAVEALLGSTPVERVAKTLLRLSKADQLAKGKVTCSQMEIASITGLSRSAVSIALAVLESSGAIRRDYGAVRIIDSQQLRQS